MTLGQEILAAWDRAELLANPTPSPREVMALMTGTRRRRDRAILAIASSPASAPIHRLILAFLLTSVAAAQVFDFATFTVMIDRRGIASEANPFVAAGFAVGGMPIVALMKIALLVLLASIVVILGRDQLRRRSGLELATLISVLAVVGGLFGGISNVLAT